VELDPPTTLVGARERVPKPGGSTVNAAVCVVLLKVAEMVAVVEVPTAEVVTVKVAVVAPAGTVMLAGTVAAGSLLVRATARPPVGAALESVSVPVELDPPTTLLGASETLPRLGG
jgi:hypothetical protein